MSTVFILCSYVDLIILVIKLHVLSISALTPKDELSRMDRGYVTATGPPNSRRPRSKPKKKKIWPANEKASIITNKRVHKHGRCRSWGHRKNALKKPLGTEAKAKQVHMLGITKILVRCSNISWLYFIPFIGKLVTTIYITKWHVDA